MPLTKHMRVQPQSSRVCRSPRVSHGNFERERSSTDLPIQCSAPRLDPSALKTMTAWSCQKALNKSPGSPDSPGVDGAWLESSRYLACQS